jgi:hypothetical protein
MGYAMTYVITVAINIINIKMSQSLTDFRVRYCITESTPIFKYPVLITFCKAMFVVTVLARPIVHNRNDYEYHNQE